MKHEFIPYEQAVALKELGFDEPCILLYRGLDTQPVCQMGYEFKTEKNSDYNDETNYWLTVPLYQQAFRWFREKHGVYTEIFVDDDKTFGFMITHFTSEGRVDSPVKYGHITYEEAESACLDKLIQIVTETTESRHTK